MLIDNDVHCLILDCLSRTKFILFCGKINLLIARRANNQN